MRQIRMPTKTFHAALMTALVGLLYLSESYADTTDVPATAAPDPKPERKRVLPFLAEEAAKSGYELPLPFGAGLVLTALDNRAIEVTDVRLKLRGEPQSISDFVNLGSTSNVFNANVKLDAWLLPFLNVYALVGYVHNDSTTHVSVTLPKPGPIPGVIQSDKVVATDLEGLIGGAGMTLAGGWKNFFMVTDVSYVKTDLGFDDEFTALIASLRTGWTGNLGGVPVQIWGGIGNWDTAATAKGHVDIEGVGRLEFEADQKPKTPWIYDVGSNMMLNKRLQLFVDLGFDFDGAYVFVIGPTYRF